MSNKVEGMIKMIKFVKKIAFRFGGTIAALAVMITAVNVNSCCAWFTYQEKMPESAMRLRKS